MDENRLPMEVFVVKWSEDGLRHNMPLHSPAGALRTLIGWCSAPEPDSCLVRIKFRRDA